jgi:ABC-type uncharacterized transport system permease subunit
MSECSSKADRESIRNRIRFPEGEGMHFTLKGIVEVFAQGWYVFCAYFAIYVLLEVRKHGEQIAAYSVVRHALWAGSFVILLHAAVVSEVLIRRAGFDFRVFDYLMVMSLSGTTIYLLGEMFEEVPKTVEAKAEQRP